MSCALSDAEISGFEYVIKPVENEQEAAAIGRIRSVSWHEAYAGLIDDAALEKRSSEYCEQGAIKMFRDGGTAALGLDRDGRIVGFIMYGACRDDDMTDRAGEVYALYTLASTYGSGLGQALLSYAEDRLVESGLDEDLVIWVLEKNGRARAFYKKQGLFPDGTIKELPELGRDVIEIRLTRDGRKPRPLS